LQNHFIYEFISLRFLENREGRGRGKDRGRDGGAENIYVAYLSTPAWRNPRQIDLKKDYLSIHDLARRREPILPF